MDAGRPSPDHREAPHTRSLCRCCLRLLTVDRCQVNSPFWGEWGNPPQEVPGCQRPCAVTAGKHGDGPHVTAERRASPPREVTSRPSRWHRPPRPRALGQPRRLPALGLSTRKREPGRRPERLKAWPPQGGVSPRRPQLSRTRDVGVHGAHRGHPGPLGKPLPVAPPTGAPWASAAGTPLPAPPTSAPGRGFTPDPRRRGTRRPALALPASLSSLQFPEKVAQSSYSHNHGKVGPQTS